jgi:hypothetical protein
MIHKYKNNFKKIKKNRIKGPLSINAQKALKTRVFKAF